MRPNSGLLWKTVATSGFKFYIEGEPHWTCVLAYIIHDNFIWFFSFLVDNIPIRVFNNYEANGVPFLKNQAMRVYASLWNADDWATQGGRVKTDWTEAPFTASYRNYNANGCVVSASGNSCNGVLNNQPWQTQGLDANGRNRIRWVQESYMIYNYCADGKRFPQGRPKECRLPRF